MKKFLFLATAAIALVACKGEAPKAVITGELSNIEDQKVFLTEIIDNNPVNTDSATMVGGKFTFTTTNVYPRPVFVTFEKNPRVGKQLLMEAGNIAIKGDFADFASVVVSGTKSCELELAYKEMVKPFQEQMDQVGKEYSELTQTLEGDALNAKRDELRAKYSEINKQQQDAIDQFIMTNNKEVYAASLAAKGDTGTYEAIVNQLAKLSPEMPANKFVDDLNTKKVKFDALQIGKPAPDFTLQTPEGTDMALSSLKGQVVLIDFWASWCGPCRAANPSVVALYNKYKDAGFTILGVSLDNDKDKWVGAIAEDSLAWNHVSDLKGWACAGSVLYGVAGIPHTFLIDQNGNIAGNNLHGAELEAKIAELTATVAPAATEESAK